MDTVSKNKLLSQAEELRSIIDNMTLNITGETDNELADVIYKLDDSLYELEELLGIN